MAADPEPTPGPKDRGGEGNSFAHKMAPERVGRPAPLLRVSALHAEVMWRAAKSNPQRSGARSAVEFAAKLVGGGAVGGVFNEEAVTELCPCGQGGAWGAPGQGPAVLPRGKRGSERNACLPSVPAERQERGGPLGRTGSRDGAGGAWSPQGPPEGDGHNYTWRPGPAAGVSCAYWGRWLVSMSMALAQTAASVCRRRQRL